VYSRSTHHQLAANTNQYPCPSALSWRWAGSRASSISRAAAPSWRHSVFLDVLLTILAATMAGQYPTCSVPTLDPAFNVTAAQPAPAAYRPARRRRVVPTAFSWRSAITCFCFIVPRKAQASAEGHGY